MRAAGALCVLLGSVPAVAAGAPTLGVLEQHAVDEALAARGLRVDPAPAGKTIGAIHIVNQDVFSARDWYFQLLNFFHRTTRDDFVRRELLLHPGDHYDQVIVDETVRNLRDPSLSNVVVVLPVMSPGAGKVDVLVVTRDVWSLRLNTDFLHENGHLVWFTGSLSENNLFGWRKRAALVFSMDLGAMAVGPTYVDPNVAGTRLTMSASASALFARESGALEGSAAGFSIAYPLYSLATRWGADFSIGHVDEVVRSFLGTHVRGVALGTALPVPPMLSGKVAADDRLRVEHDGVIVPWVYRSRRFGVVSTVRRSFPGRVIQRVSLGHAFSVRRPSFMEDFPADESLREQFRRQVFPRSERISSLVAAYSVFTPRFRTYRDFATFDLAEDQGLGPSLNLDASRASTWIGSDRDFFGLGAGGSWTLDALDGLQRLGVRWGGRLEQEKLVDESLSFGTYLASPVLARAVRIVASADMALLINNTQNTRFSLGASNGLRGYEIGDFLGRGAQFIAHVELRSMAVKVLTLPLGGLVFYDVGDAANRAAALVAHHDAGLGLRLLIPHLNTYVLRLDWAFAMQTTDRTRAGLPGRISFGFQQVF